MIIKGIMPYFLWKEGKQMKWIFQLSYILLFSVIGEILHVIVPVAVPAGIYGMLLLLICLCLRVISLEKIHGVANFLIEIISVCFIPAGVGLMTKWAEFQEILLPILLEMFLVTVLVFFVTGRVAQAIVRRSRKGEQNE